MAGDIKSSGQGWACEVNIPLQPCMEIWGSALGLVPVLKKSCVPITGELHTLASQEKSNKVYATMLLKFTCVSWVCVIWSLHECSNPVEVTTQHSCVSILGVLVQIC